MTVVVDGRGCPRRSPLRGDDLPRGRPGRGGTRLMVVSIVDSADVADSARIGDGSSSAASRRSVRMPCSVRAASSVAGRMWASASSWLELAGYCSRACSRFILFDYWQDSGTASKEGVHVELTKTHQDLAAELGTVRELVSRNLSRLQAEGFLEVDGRRIIVKDLAGLKREQKASE